MIITILENLFRKLLMKLLIIFMKQKWKYLWKRIKNKNNLT